jgi:tripartite-type tricarboxylate transporter receptor subunit TctC
MIALSRRGLLALVGTASQASAQERRTLRLIVAFAPGGGTDLMARAVAQKMSEILASNIVVENRPGGNGTVGSLAVAQSRPDGATLLFGTGSELSLKPLLEAGLPYDPEVDFAPVALLGVTPVVVAVNPRVPARTMQEFVALARSRPGSLNVAMAGTGSPGHLAAAYIAAQAGIEYTVVPYRGAAPAVADTVAGVTDAVISGLPPVLAQAREGQLRILAVSIPTRVSAIPDVPTLAEVGFAGFDISNTVGLVVRRGTPPETIAALNAAANQAIRDPEVRRIFTTNGAEPIGSSPEEYAAFIRTERETLREAVRVTGIRMQ